ncbi:putative nicotinamidase [Monocercomonoides exilis]|uniref:putative nicotinamidase n=1 Tax=Monocercomonoides exilis TaxID=2049356 RepID=UPI00355A095A|nr:putative nicotinamidase [Monocercomonoides exilis]|eukprot:MONOS_3730.1-p1 / transcript=MONOS_3730.1 / gene=MONOS_3730 / organism=Monocercomonoides_exilis_PA203 / gene_product=nicotinamidase / transcript_product=nicotinamidase / location=Mono_scaffold00090:128164-128906(-) / protein_length=209 / sequence_SO=supercontig / SO=protein_coding / is_pseudo=false
MAKRTALLIIDVQYDFLEGGSLATNDANAVIPIINEIRNKVHFDDVVVSKDWHPKGHCSFASSHPGKALFEDITLPDGTPQKLWPDHCVQGSHGAEVHSDLKLEPTDFVVFKGQHAEIDSYSAFFDNAHKAKTTLQDHLQSKAITDVIVVGIALDYCVCFTAMDAKDLGYTTTVVEDACRGVAPESTAAAVENMKKKGINLIKAETLLG